MNEKIAKVFASLAETDILDKVLLKITIENQKGKYFISLDNSDYTLYLEEKEILLQAGLVAKVISVQ